MNKINFTDYPNTTTPVSANNLNVLQTNVENEFTATMSNVQDALDEKVSTSVANSTYEKKGTLLWTNSSPTSSFSAQTITLNDTLSNYDCYEIIWETSNTGAIKNSTGIIPVGNKTELFTVYYSGGVRVRYRQITSISGSSITFGDANENGTTGNSNNIPLYVIGYKTGLF